MLDFLKTPPLRVDAQLFFPFLRSPRASFSLAGDQARGNSLPNSPPQVPASKSLASTEVSPLLPKIPKRWCKPALMSGGPWCLVVWGLIASPFFMTHSLAVFQVPKKVPVFFSLFTGFLSPVFVYTCSLRGAVESPARPLERFFLFLRNRGTPPRGLPPFQLASCPPLTFTLLTKTFFSLRASSIGASDPFQQIISLFLPPPLFGTPKSDPLQTTSPVG